MERSDLDSQYLNDPDLPALVAQAMEERDAGATPDIAAICAERPELAGAVTASLATSEQLLALQKQYASHDRWTGRLLAERYRLDARIGAGAMGVVYGGEDLELQRPIAVKILRGGLVEGAEAEHRFAREAEAMAAVQHPSIINVYDRGRTNEGDAFLVMERLEGEPLSETLDFQAQKGSDSIDVRTAVLWAADLAAGLQAAHERGVFHRDVKPSNIFIKPDGTPVLLDFGIAARVDQATITREEAAIGTPAYMAPESLSPKKKPAATLDVYSLTATLYHMLSRRAPYTGTPSQVIARLVTSDPAPVSRLAPGLPRDLQAIVDQGMARRVSDRYASATELEQDLRAFLEFKAVAARPISAPVRVWRRARRSTAFWLAVGVVALGLGLRGWMIRQDAIAAERIELAAKKKEIYDEADRRLHPNLNYGARANRVLSIGEGRNEAATRLDTMVENRSAPLPSLMTRAAFRLDHGDPKGAASDMQRIAAEVQTQYAKDLAGRYAALPASADAFSSVDLNELPEPVTADDMYLAAVHAFRGDPASFPALISDSRLDGCPNVAALRIFLTIQSDAVAAHESLLAIEAQHLGRTAQTALQVGAALMLDKRYPEAEAALEQGLALQPGSFRTRENLGLVETHLGKFDEAEEHLGPVINWKPEYSKPHFLLARVLIEKGDLQEAERMAQNMPYPQGALGNLWRESLAAGILTERALIALESDKEAARLLAKQASESFGRAAEHLRHLGPSNAPLATARYAVAQAIAGGNEHGVFDALLRMVTDSKSVNKQLEGIIKHVPSDAAPALAPFLQMIYDNYAHDINRALFEEPRPPQNVPQSKQEPYPYD